MTVARVRTAPLAAEFLMKSFSAGKFCIFNVLPPILYEFIINMEVVVGWTLERVGGPPFVYTLTSCSEKVRKLKKLVGRCGRYCYEFLAS